MKKLKLSLLCTCFLLGTVFHVQAQNDSDSWKTETRVNLLFGTNQLLLGGFNIEGNLFYRRFVFDYSHGVSLNIDNEFLDDTNQEYGIDVHIPWTTGFGIGYRLTEWLNVRAEPKWHRFELYNMGDEQSAENRITAYNTFSLGVGAYANFQPFKNQDNFLKGIMVAPSIRWWPRVSSSLENDETSFFSRALQDEVTHEALEVGIANTPLIINLSIGYTVPLN